MGRFPPGLRHDQLRLMIQSLLEDRFKLKLGHETKQLSVYTLVVAKNGPKLHEAKPNDTYDSGLTNVYGLPAGPHRGAGQSGHLTVQSLPMATVAEILSEQLGSTVIDKTGMTREYDFTLDWTPDENDAQAGGKQGSSNSSTRKFPRASIFTAIEQQLGLKLELQKVPTEFLVIDYAEQPHTAGIAELEPALSDGTKTRTRGAVIPPVFKAVSIKAVSSELMPGIWFTADTLHAKNVSLQMLMKAAYSVEDNQISGRPSWLNSDRFDVQAKYDKSVVDAMQPLSQDQRLLQQKHLLQEFLADRFRLTLHRENAGPPAYDLVIAQKGFKLHEATPGDTYATGVKRPDGLPVGPGTLRFQSGQLIGQGVPVSLLVRELSRELGGAVRDKTGLTGNYDFTLRWTPDEKQPAMLEGSSGASLFAVLEKQLGLKLESPNGPVLVIDHVEKPSEN
jgi:uncharacterized protein (TIGR03435 family)